MKIPIKVSGQKMNLPSYYEFIAPRSQKFVKFVFAHFEKIKVIVESVNFEKIHFFLFGSLFALTILH